MGKIDNATNRLTEAEFNAILWRAMIAVIKAWGMRHGFCQDIEIVK